MAWAQIRVLKADLFGRVEQVHLSERGPKILAVRRDIAAARWWVRWLARSLARREQRALLALDGLDAVPRALGADRNASLRSWLEGEPMHLAQPPSIEYFAQAHRLLVQLHRRGITHNDLAKEPNWLVTPVRPAGADRFSAGECSPATQQVVPSQGQRRSASPTQAQAKLLPGIAYGP